MSPQDQDSSFHPQPASQPEPQFQPQSPSPFSQVSSSPTEGSVSLSNSNNSPFSSSAENQTPPSPLGSTGTPSPDFTPVNPAFASGLQTNFAPKQSKKKLTLIIIAAVVALLGIGGGIAFAVWNNSPDKILNDAFTNTLNTPPSGTTADMNVTSNGNTVKLSVSSWTDGEQNGQATLKIDVTNEGNSFSFTVGAIAAKNGDLYIKAQDIQKLVTQYFAGSPEYASLFDGIIQKVDNKWVKITEADIKKLTGDENSADSTCINNALESFTNDQAQKKELRDLYVKNQFILVKSQKADETVNNRSSYHFVLDANKDKAKAFGEGFKQTTLYKKIKSCLGDSFKDDTADSTSNDDTVSSVEIWIDKANRRINKVSFTASADEAKSEAKVNAVLDYTTKTVTVPSEFTTVDELQQEIEQLYTTLFYLSPSSSMPFESSSSLEL